MRTVLTKIFIWCALLIVPAFQADASTLSSALFPDSETGTVVIKDRRSGDVRARGTYRLQRKTVEGRTLYDFIQEGDGDYDHFQDVLWVVEAQWGEHNGLIRVLESTCTVTDKNGNVMAVYQKAFDYDRNIISFLLLGPEKQVVHSATFPIKGPTSDDKTLVFFLRPLVAGLDRDHDRRFYLLSSEPRLYDVHMRFIKEETLETPMGPRETVKLQLFADLGPLTQLALRVVPRTFIWYQKDDPSVWLKYEGLETGRKSAYVETYLAEMQRGTD